MIREKNPIYALATSKTRSAIAVFRISGKGSHKIITKISSNKKWKANTAKINYLVDENNEKIDKTLTTFFKKPKTYTGEDMVEISCHGGLAIINKISDILNKSGLREAEPGEFTKRSLQNNKIDLTQAEGVSDIVNAETEKQRILALNNVDGHTSSFSKELNKKVMKLLADTGALIDFSDEELPDNTLSNIKEQNKNIIRIIKKSLLRSKIAKPLREGFLVSVIGKPNTGKSSFINYISQREVAIVTSIPGTTTDSLEIQIDIDGYKFRFIDTAGIRKHKNIIEKIGIEKAHKTTLISDINLVFLNSVEKSKYSKINNKIFVRSKFDIRKKKVLDKEIIDISSKNGHGIKKLIQNIKKRLTITDAEKIPIFSRERHIEKITNCLKILESINFKSSPDKIAEDIRAALKENTQIYEKFDIEKILDIIFADFCIGK